MEHRDAQLLACPAMRARDDGSAAAIKGVLAGGSEELPIATLWPSSQTAGETLPVPC